MNYRIVTTRISAQGLVPLRSRARHVGELFGLDRMQCTRFVTALSELARNAVQYAGEGTVTFVFDSGSADEPGQRLLARVSDHGPGIDDLPAVLGGRLNALMQVPMGLAGCKRLVDKLEFELPEEGGTVVTMAIALSRNAPQLDAAGVASRTEDLTRRKAQTPLEELEQQNREMLGALQELRAKQVELERADLRKNRFLAMLAHELRNPLATLHLSLDLMRRKKDMTPAQVTHQHDVMGRQVAQLTRLVEDLMDVSRVSQDKVELHPTQVDLNSLAGEALEMTQGAIEAKHHRVEFLPASGQLTVQVDAMRMKQVLSNVIHNAARYTPAHGEIVVALRQEGSFAVVDVRDNGIGISSEMLPHVFDMFVQGEARTDAVPSGLGVGLTLARRLVEKHGGAVAVQSAGAGLGSRFTVSLPLQGSA